MTELYKRMNSELPSLFKQIHSQANITLSRTPTGKATAKFKDANINDWRYIHSHEDPVYEAEMVIRSLPDLEKSDHVLFIGVGMGYQIEFFQQMYPNTPFSVIEPIHELFQACLNDRDFGWLDIERIWLFSTKTSDSPNGMDVFIKQFAMNPVLSPTHLTVCILPAYQQLLSIDVSDVYKEILLMYRNKFSTVATVQVHRFDWLENSCKNFPYNNSTPSFYRSFKDAFTDKPVIIVSAGPSLNHEFEHLRTIYEQDMAYIFAVGSTIKTLCKQNIKVHGFIVMDTKNEEKGNELLEPAFFNGTYQPPLVYISTVGPNLLRKCPTPMYHILSERDLVAHHLLEDIQSDYLIHDHATVAVSAFELFTDMGCNPVILAGQNLGYLNKQKYASGIDYGYLEKETEWKLESNQIAIKSVDGSEMYTTPDFHFMKSDFEGWIKKVQLEQLSDQKPLKVINTTRQGAHIEGAEFMTMDQVIEHVLTPNNVNKQWNEHALVNESDASYRMRKQNLDRKIANNIQELDMLSNIVETSIQHVFLLDQALFLNNEHEARTLIDTIDAEFRATIANGFYKVYLLTVMENYLTQIARGFVLLENKHKNIEELTLLKRNFGNWFIALKEAVRICEPLFKELQKNPVAAGNEGLA